MPLKIPITACVVCLLLASCSGTPPTRADYPPIPASLMQPCANPEPLRTGDLAEMTRNHRQAMQEYHLRCQQLTDLQALARLRK